MTRSPVTALALLASAALLAAPAAGQETTAPAETPAAPAPSAAYDASTVLATVNGTPITLGLLRVVYLQIPQQYQGYPGEILTPALLDQLINQILLAQAGEKDGLGEGTQLRIALENFRREEIAGAYIRAAIAAEVTEEAVRKTYEEKVAALPPEEEVNAAHILVESEDKAKEIVAKLAAGADFAELARESTDVGSGSRGGDLGWFGRGMMVPEFENAVFALKPGEVSAPVQSRFGWHVIKLLGTREKPKPTLPEVRDQIVAELSNQAVRARIEALRGAATIERPETGVPADALKDPAVLPD